LILTATVKAAEYHVGPHILLCLADAEIRHGAAEGNRFKPLRPSQLSSKSKFESCDSPSKPASAPRNYGRGASATGTGAISQNGCSRSGECQWTQMPASVGKLRGVGLGSRQLPPSAFLSQEEAYIEEVSEQSDRKARSQRPPSTLHKPILISLASPSRRCLIFLPVTLNNSPRRFSATGDRLPSIS
jgi:hypothetical protein